MIIIKRFIHFFIIIMLAVIYSGCGEKSVPVSGAASDLQARFEEAFEDSQDSEDYDNTENTEDYSVVSETVVFESAAEPLSETAVITSEIIQNTIEITETSEITEITETEITNVIDASNDITAEQEEQFVITPSGARYHVKGCHTAHNIKEYLTRAEAVSRGYEPCKICKP